MLLQSWLCPSLQCSRQTPIKPEPSRVIVAHTQPMSPWCRKESKGVSDRAKLHQAKSMFFKSPADYAQCWIGCHNFTGGLLYCFTSHTMTYPLLMTNALCCLSSSQLWRSTSSMASNSCCTSVACGLTSHGACYPTEAWKRANLQSWLWGVHCAVPYSSRTSSWNKQLPVINAKAVVGWTLASALLFPSPQFHFVCVAPTDLTLPHYR